MTCIVAKELSEGVIWAASSGEYLNGDWEPCVLVPISSIAQMTDRELGETIRKMLPVAKKAEALQYAEYITGRSKSLEVSELQDTYMKRAWASILPFAGQDNDIDRAIAIIRELLSREEIIKSKRQATQKMRGGINKRYEELFVQIGRRDGFSCRLCGTTSSDLQIDHIVPVAKDGDNDMSNLQLLCKSCNSRKSDS